MILLREGGDLFMELETLVGSEMPAQQLMFFPSGSGQPAGFFLHGMPERGLIEWVLETFISPDSVFIDAGAHIGTYTWTCGQKALHTYAFECTPITFCHLAANVALYGLADKVDLHQVALGDHEGRQDLYIRSSDGGINGVKRLTASDTPSRQVLVTRLDSIDIRGPVGLIKLDVEGSEREVILGATELLQRNNLPPILFESWGDWKEAEGVPAVQMRKDLFATLYDLGYAVFKVNNAEDMFLAVRSDTVPACKPVV